MMRLLKRVLRLDGAALVSLGVAGLAASQAGARPEATQVAAVGAAVVAAMLVLPAVDPIRKMKWDDRGLPRARLGIALATAAGALLLAGPLSGAATDEAQRLHMLVLVVVLAVAGNVFPAARRNAFFGIRTPWTLRDDRVWAQTHRLFGHLLVGTMAVLAALWPLLGAAAFEAALGAVAVSLGLGSIAYSWLLSRRLPPLT